MKHLIGIEDFSIDEIDELIKVSEDIISNKEKYLEKCKGKILATLFLEPSTRTRLSFESAMLSLGGNVIGFSSAENSSTKKGETLADTITVVSKYCDIIAMRHPNEGAALVASENSDVPVINAGDGGHNHPTQTLLDLLTIKEEKGRLDNFTIGICGDLKFGRTVHSLITALARYENIKFVLISPPELKIPGYIKYDILEKNNLDHIETDNLEENIGKLDVLYMTRVQQERFESQEDYLRLKDVYILDKEKMKNAKEDLCILHPLPRINEIATEIDLDERACYFKQAEYGRYMRMAIILKLLNEKDEKIPDLLQEEKILDKEECQNPRCITKFERNLKQIAVLKEREKGIYRCKYCDSIINI